MDGFAIDAILKIILQTHESKTKSVDKRPNIASMFFVFVCRIHDKY